MTVSRRRASSTRTAGGSASRRRPPVGGPRTDGADNPTHDEIARRAYGLYEERGGGHGRDWEDWLQAERELRGNPPA
jgi:hypothetical protein